ncbi:MAG: Rha family transcriptional regulator [Flavobacteriaceae bacterium]|nr:Rha family transcriptional regulator [Flavobacteriaceae bacterium]
MVALAKTDTMSSREIARIVGKPHNDLMKAIREMEKAWERTTGKNFPIVNYQQITGNGTIREFPEYQLNKMECLYIATKFNNEARARLIVRWAELEEKAVSRKQEAIGYGAKINALPREERERAIIDSVKEERFELICLIRQYMKRGDMAKTAKELGYCASSVQDVMLGRQWNESIVKAMHEKAMANKQQSLFDVRGMIEELKK